MIRNIQITPVLNGFILQVGCQPIAYTDTNKLLGDVGDYLRNPEETEKKFLEKEAINKDHLMPPEKQAYHGNRARENACEGNQVVSAATQAPRGSSIGY